MMNWWAPRGFTMLSADMDARVGGRWSVRMRAPAGTEHVEAGIVREFVRNQRLVLTQAWQNAAGVSGHQTLMTLDFAARDGKACCMFRQGTFESKRSRDEHDDGWVSALGLLAEHLGAHLGTATLGQPGATGELLRHARPVFEIVRAYVAAGPKRSADDDSDDPPETRTIH
jgi:uncharacterized protein YndB with AHSA1/START domain